MKNDGETAGGSGGTQTGFKVFKENPMNSLEDITSRKIVMEHPSEIDSAMKELFKAHKFKFDYFKSDSASQELLIKESEERLAKLLGVEKVNSSFKDGKLYIEDKPIKFIAKNSNSIFPIDDGKQTYNRYPEKEITIDTWNLQKKANEVKKREALEKPTKPKGFLEKLLQPKTIGDIAREKQEEKLAMKNAESKSGNIVSRFFSKIFSRKETTFGEILEEMAEKGKIHR